MSNEPTVKRWSAKRKAAVVMGYVHSEHIYNGVGCTENRGIITSR